MPAFYELARLAREQSAVRKTTGFTGVEVYLLPDLDAYLKMGTVGRISDLRREAEILKWLENSAPVPRVIDYVSKEDCEALLISVVDGEPLSQILRKVIDVDEAEALIEVAAQALAAFHRFGNQTCPFDTRLDWRYERAKRNVDQRLLSETDDEFSAEHEGKSPSKVLSDLIDDRPADEDLVFTHGDPSLPNIIFHEAIFRGFIDLDNAGVADRYSDIAIFLKSVSHNTGLPIHAENAFCRGYGTDYLDPQKLAFYSLMDDLF
jgi:aminoglycoside phosphotransferase